MKDSKFELHELNHTEMVGALCKVLIKKGVISESDLEQEFQSALDKKNKQLEKELKEDPVTQFIFNTLKRGESE